MTPIRIHIDRRWSAGLEEVWSLLSDTDAFNRAAGLGMRFQVGPDGARGHMRAGGIPVEWDELPFDFCQNAWFRTRREYEGGLVASATATAKLEVAPDDRVQVAYVVELEPRYALLWPLLWVIAHLVVRPQLHKGFRAIEQALRGGRQLWDPPPPLSPEARSLLDDRIGEVGEDVRTSIRTRLQSAPLAVQDRLRPRWIARQDGHAVDAVTRGLLDATRAGLLQVRWLVLCPSCQGDESDRSVLSLGNRDVHCTTCGIRYDGALADNVEIVFRPTDALRSKRAVIDCLMSPQRTPHVVLQAPVAPGEELGFHATLGEGTFTLELGEESVEVVVREGGRVDADVRFEDGGVFPGRLVLAPGKHAFRVRSALEHPARAVFQRRWRPSYGVTASHILSSPALAELLPEANLSPALQTAAWRGSVLVVDTRDGDAFDETRDMLERFSDGCFEIGFTTVAATFRSVPAVLAAAEGLSGLGMAVCGAIGAGVLLELTQDDERTIAGAPVEDALEAVRHLSAPQFALASTDEELLTAMAGHRSLVKVVRPSGMPPILAFAATIDGPSLPFRPRGLERTVTPVALDVPERIGVYRVVRELDEGAMGVVLEVEEEMGAKRYALKMPKRAVQPRALHAFLQEGLAAKRIRHPNVVAFQDWGVDAGRPFMVMELLRGHSLADEVGRKGPLGLERTLEVVVAVLDGLSAVHEEGLVHRDVKPANVFVLEEPGDVPAGVKLLDFGLVRSQGGAAQRVAGTPDFMAPEQVLGTGVDARTDLFAIGLLVHWCLTGVLPFDGDTSGQRALERLESDLQVDDAALGPLAGLVRRTLALDPRERPATASELRTALLEVAG